MLFRSYAVVDAPSVADDVYRAILNVSPVLLVKSCVAVSSSTLKLVHIACEIAIRPPI